MWTCMRALCSYSNFDSLFTKYTISVELPKEAHGDSYESVKSLIVIHLNYVYVYCLIYYLSIQLLIQLFIYLLYQNIYLLIH